ncbi:MAG: sodium-dependent transporter [Proteobacteria bacterium]|nr:sodium-dependent transporter [Pseudomonadota bacterium]NOG61196.1 sodium-dependent transporter [Pseudomonadota bacterium]
MSVKRSSIHGQWSSRWAFILAATGSAVGLGNIWRFPYLTGENGGGAFVLVYLVCVVMVGIPIMMAEILLGRRGRQSPIHTMETLAAEEGLSPHWKLLGWMGVVAGFIILSYYSVIAGWTLAYIFRIGAGVFVDADAGLSKKIFTDLISDPEKLLAWHTTFLIMSVIVVSRGVKNGLEQAVKFLMPTLFILLLIMVGYAMSTDKFVEGMSYLFVPNFELLAEKNFFSDIFLPALGQAFFSLSIGMGAIMIYGSYLSQKSSITFNCFTIAIADTSVAILAGIAIFPIVFTYGLEPAGGPGLIFITLPIAFGQMPFGTFFGCLFFILLLFAAWTSAISLLEPAVTWLVENRNMTRVKAAALAGAIAWLLGLVTVLSFNHWAFSFNFAGSVKENGFFDIFDILTSNIMLPIGGLLVAIFAAWLMSRKSTVEELGLGDGAAYQAWHFAVKYIAPFGVIIIFLNAIGLFRLLGLGE